MDAIQITTVIAAAIGALTGIGAFIISLRADRRSERAEERAERAQKQAELAQQWTLWTEAIMAAHELVTLNVMEENPKGQLMKLRATMLELVDGPPGKQYRHLTDWLRSEHERLTLSLEYAMASMQGKPYTIETVEPAHKPAHTAAGSIVTNLRHFRAAAPDAEADREMESLIAVAQKNSAEFRAALGENRTDD